MNHTTAHLPLHDAALPIGTSDRDTSREVPNHPNGVPVDNDLRAYIVLNKGLENIDAPPVEYCGWTYLVQRVVRGYTTYYEWSVTAPGKESSGVLGRTYTRAAAEDQAKGEIDRKIEATLDGERWDIDRQ